jgi:hypothetical protein
MSTAATRQPLFVRLRMLAGWAQCDVRTGRRKKLSFIALPISYRVTPGVIIFAPK